MEVEEIEIDSTVIRFFDDYITEGTSEIQKKTLDITFTNAIQKAINKVKKIE